MNSKQGAISTVITILVLLFVGWAIYNVVVPGTNKVFASNILPFLMTEEEKKAQEEERQRQKDLYRS